MNNQSKPLILIIEDDEFLANIYKSKFEVEGYKVQVENNGEDGYYAILKKKPTVVLLDVLLPGIDGFTILKRVKESKKTQHIPVILLTNLGDKKDVEKGITLGADDYLIKAHFKPSETVTKVNQLLNR